MKKKKSQERGKKGEGKTWVLAMASSKKWVSHEEGCGGTNQERGVSRSKILTNMTQRK